MNWLLFLKYENGNYEIKQAGSNIVPTEDFDKVLPTTEKLHDNQIKFILMERSLN